MKADRIAAAADLAGTIVFAIQGALIAGGAGLDWLGILVVAFAAAVGGGMIRDVLIGATPPAALRGTRYVAAVLVSAALVLVTGEAAWARTRPALLVLDAAGLALFAVAGTEKALDAGCGGTAAAILGTVTATGGGVLRDILLARVPVILRTDFYATAAVAGACVLVLLRRAGIPAPIAALAGGATCFALRLSGAALGWRLPTF